MSGDWITATVKAVISGDTLHLIGKALSAGPPPEIVVTLASLHAPHLSRGTQQQSEDPFAWQSREFCRQLCIGKTVQFQIINCVTAINRTFGDVNIAHPITGAWVSLASLIVAAGWSAVKDSRESRDSSAHEELVSLEAAAKSAKLGIHAVATPTNSTRVVNWNPTVEEISAVVEAARGTKVKVLVEAVRDGSALRVLYQLPAATTVAATTAPAPASTAAIASAPASKTGKAVSKNASSSATTTTTTTPAPATATATAAVVTGAPRFVSLNFSFAGVQSPRCNTASSNGTGGLNNLLSMGSVFAAATTAATAAATVGGEDEDSSDSEGAAAPRSAARRKTGNNANNNSNNQAEPFALQARHFTEMRLLNREVEVDLSALDIRASSGNNTGNNSNNGCTVLGSLFHPKGSIACELVRNGLARVMEKSLPNVSKGLALALRQAEYEAKQHHRSLWHDYHLDTATGVSVSVGGGVSVNGITSNLANASLVTGSGVAGAGGVVGAVNSHAVGNAGKVVTGVVLEVMSGDSILLLVKHASGDEEEIKIALASIKAPKIAPPARNNNNTLTTSTTTTPTTTTLTPVPPQSGPLSEPWAVESREWLRSRLIGKTVSVLVEYEKYLSTGARSSDPSSPAVSLRLFGSILNTPTLTPTLTSTVTATSTTTAASGGRATAGVSASGVSGDRLTLSQCLLLEGLATVVRHRGGDAQKASNVDLLLLAEAEAAVKGKGLHSANPAPSSLLTNKLTDLTSADAKRTRALLASSFHKPLRAVVEFVFSGSRLKLHLLAANTIVQLSLAQVRCPLAARASSKLHALASRAGQPFAEEARRFTRRLLLQRTVEVVVTDVDKNGIALGYVYTVVEPTAASGVSSGERGGVSVKLRRTGSLALQLLTEGLARVDNYAYGDELETSVSGGERGESRQALEAAQESAREVSRGVWSVQEEEKAVVKGEGDGEDADSDDGDAEEEDELEEGEVREKKTASNKNKGNNSKNKSNNESSALAKWAVGTVGPVVVSEIISGTHFFVQSTSPAALATLTSITDLLLALAAVAPTAADMDNTDNNTNNESNNTDVTDATTTTTTPSTGAAGRWRAGQLVAVLYEEGAASYWCRARIETVLSTNKQALVQHVDYGNKEIIDLTRVLSLADLPTQFASLSLSATPALAAECHLAFVSRVRDAGDGATGGLAHLSARFLDELVWGKALVMAVVGMERERERGARGPAAAGGGAGGRGGGRGDRGRGGRGGAGGGRGADKEKAAAAGAAGNNVKLFVMLYSETQPAPVPATTAATAGVSVEGVDGVTAASVPATVTSVSVSPIAAAVAHTNESVNAKMVREGLGIVTTTLTSSSSSATGGRRGGGDRGRVGVCGFNLNPFTSLSASQTGGLSSLSQSLLLSLEVAQQAAYYEHLHVFRYGDPGEQESETDE